MNTDDELNYIDEKIRSELVERKNLTKLLGENTQRIGTYEDHKALILKKDKSEFSVFRSIPDHVESIFKEKRKPLYISEILSELNDRGIESSMATISTALIRYVNKDKRFQRVAPNTYYLLEENNEQR